MVVVALEACERHTPSAVYAAANRARITYTHADCVRCIVTTRVMARLRHIMDERRTHTVHYAIVSCAKIQGCAFTHNNCVRHKIKSQKRVETNKKRSVKGISGECTSGRRPFGVQCTHTHTARHTHVNRLVFPVALNALAAHIERALNWARGSRSHMRRESACVLYLRRSRCRR